MNIAYVLAENISINGTSGASAHVRENIKHFQKAGHEVFLVTNYQKYLKNAQVNRANHFQTKSKIFSVVPNFVKIFYRNWRTKKSNQNLLKQNKSVLNKCDLVYERDSFSNFEISEYCKKQQIPYVIECNGFFWGKTGSTFHKSSIPKLYKNKHICKWQQADHLIAVSANFKNKMISAGVDPSKIAVIHNGVNLEAHLQVTKKDVNKLRQKMGFENQIVVGFVGHVLEKHRIDLLLKSIKLLDDANYPVKGLIVGGGIWQNYQKQALEMSIADKVVFTGAVEFARVPLLVATMDICTLPGCNNYDSPVKLFDYGAAKRPVVAADFSNVREIIRDNENGLLFEQNSLANFVDKLKILVDSRSTREILGNSLFQTIKINHTWQKVAERTLNIFEQIIQPK
ncbi:glycosyltransferase family 4 protein [Myxosarcina sp. GI1(2024)]